MLNYNQDVLNSVAKLVPAENSLVKVSGVADKARLDTALRMALAVCRTDPDLEAIIQSDKTEIKKRFFGNVKIEGEKQTYVLTNDQIKNITKIVYNPVVFGSAKKAKDIVELKTLLADKLETSETKGSTDTYRGMVAGLPKQGSYDLIKKIFLAVIQLDLGNLKKVFSFITNLENTSEAMISNQDDQEIIAEKLPATFSHFSKILKDSPLNQSVA